MRVGWEDKEDGLLYLKPTSVVLSAKKENRGAGGKGEGRSENVQREIL